jgi:hypothetical protein
MIITERLGVPDNIITVATDIYKYIIKQLRKEIKQNPTVDELHIKYDEPVTIGQAKFESTDIKIISIITDKIDVPQRISLGNATSQRSVPQHRRMVFVGRNKIKIQIEIAMPQSNRDIFTLMDALRDKVGFVGDLSHELAHAYDNYNRKYNTYSSLINYGAIVDTRTNVKPMDEFIFLLYFTNAFENVVRPSEVATMMHTKRVTKKTFLKFLTSTKIYSYLKLAKEFKFNDLVSKLHDNIHSIEDLISQVFDRDDDELEALLNATDDDKIAWFLGATVNALGNASINTLHSMVLSPLEQLFGEIMNSEVRDVIQKYTQQHAKRAVNYITFYKQQEKYLNMVGSKMIKKISKLYDIALDENKSIVNWELYHLIHGTNRNTIEYLKSRRKF